jgi:hypothetical protein
VSDIESRLVDLRKVLNESFIEAPTEAVAEALFYAVEGENYEVNDSETVFSREVSAGRRIEVTADLAKDSITLAFVNQSMNQSDWSKVDKSWSNKLQVAKEILVSGGWRIKPESSYSQKTIVLAADASADFVRANFDKVMESAARGVDKVRLD